MSLANSEYWSLDFQSLDPGEEDRGRGEGGVVQCISSLKKSLLTEHLFYAEQSAIPDAEE